MCHLGLRAACPPAKVAAFLARCRYLRLADYAPRDAPGYAAVRCALEAHEASAAASASASAVPIRAGRLFYMATPPEVFPLAAAAVAQHLSPAEETARGDISDALVGGAAAAPPGDVPRSSQAAQAAPRRALGGASSADDAAAATQAQAMPRAVLRPWVRLIIEKPFGRDGASAAQLEAALRSNFPEEARLRAAGAAHGGVGDASSIC
jgi:hypothetical protein